MAEFAAAAEEEDEVAEEEEEDFIPQAEAEEWGLAAKVSSSSLVVVDKSEKNTNGRTS